jgi:hypothetical protein
MKTKKNESAYLFYLITIVLLCSLSAATWSPNTSAKDDTKKYVYKIKPVSEPISINSDWNKKVWNDTEAVRLINYMGDKPTHFPDTQAKVRCDDKNIYVIFRVKDQYVRAVAKEIHGRVWEDSCVEFFFTPGPDISRGYFNMETNCKGIFGLGYTKNSAGDRAQVETEDCKKITISHSLQKDAEIEITEPVTWTIEYCIPISLLEKYMKVDKPGKGVQWRANFYKCGDKTSHLHWLTWAPVINPTPKFHLPEYFGWLEF